MKLSRYVMGCCVGVIALCIGVANGDQDWWSGSASNDWFVPSNWQGFSVPLATDDAYLPPTLAGFTVPRIAIELTASTTVHDMFVDLLAYPSQQSVGYSIYGDNGNTLTVTNDLTVRSFSNIPGKFRVSGVSIESVRGLFGDGTELTIENGGELHVSDELYTGIISKFVVNSGTISAETLTLDDESTITINSGGTVAAGFLSATHDPNSGWGKPSITINSGGTLDLVGVLESHEITDGTLTINSNGSLVMPSATLEVAGTSGRINLNTNHNIRDGAVLVLKDGADVVGSSYFDVGYQSVGTLLVEDAGSSVTVTGGTTSDWGSGSGAQAFVVFQSGASGSYANLQAGTSNAFARVELLAGASLQAGTFTMGGGATVRQVSLDVSGISSFTTTGAATFNNQADVNLISGSVSFNAGATFNAGSRLDWSGGSLSLGANSTLIVDNAVVNKTDVNGFIFGGSTTTRIRNGATFSSASYFDVGTATLIVDNATLNAGTSPGAGISDWGSAGTANVQLINNAVATYSSGLRTSVSGGTAIATISTGARLLTTNLSAGGTLTSNTSFSVNGTNSVLHASGDITLSKGSSLTSSTGGRVFIGDVAESGDVFGIDSIISDTNSIASNAGGKLSVTNGALFDHAGNLLVGKELGQAGSALVNGASSRLLSNGIMVFGLGGDARLDLQTGGRVETLTSFFTAWDTLATSTVNVTGPNVLLKAGDTLFFGRQGDSTVTISAGGRALSIQRTVIGEMLGGHSTVTVTGVNSSMSAGTTLVVGMPGAGAHSLSVSDSAFVDASAIEINADSSVSVSQNALLEVYSGGPITNHGELNVFTSGEVRGEVTSFGEIDLNNADIVGGVTLRSGASLSADGSTVASLLQDAGASMEVELRSAIDFDNLTVLGNASLNGRLAVTLSGGFAPTLGSQFQIMLANAVTSPFQVEDFLAAPLASGLGWDVLYGSNSVTLSVSAALPGDFDFDGDVDGRDFLVWQRNPSIGDLADWQGNYGTGMLTANSTAVPEPGCLIIVFAVLAVIPARLRCADQCCASVPARG
jgi:T5SS/PEP-CTERM-associated repeat protein